MTRILSASATVEAGSRAVAFSGPPLSDANCPQDGTVVLGGSAYFIASRTDTSHFEITRDYEGESGTVSCEIDPLNANAINLVRVSRSITDYSAQLALLDANGRGLFYSIIGVTGGGDPGPGQMAFDNASPDSVTAIYIDVLDANQGGRDVSALIDLWRPGSVLVVRSIASTAYAAFQLIAAPVVAAGWRKLLVIPIGADGVLANDLVAIEWRLASEVANDSVTNALLANMATATIKGRATAGTGDPEDLTGPQVRSLIGAVNKAGDTLTGRLLFNDSTSTSAPVVSFDGDSDTGIAHPAANTISWVTNGVDRLRNNDGTLSATLPGGSTRYPAHLVRAWAQWSGKGTVTLNGAGNVSSITDFGDGLYGVNFATALPNTTYSAVCSAEDTSLYAVLLAGANSYSTASVRVYVGRDKDTYVDGRTISVHIVF